MNKATLRKELLELSPAERLELIGELWDSIPPQDVPLLTAEQVAEAEQEWAEHQKDPGAAMQWDDVRNWLRSRLK